MFARQISSSPTGEKTRKIPYQSHLTKLKSKLDTVKNKQEEFTNVEDFNRFSLKLYGYDQLKYSLKTNHCIPNVTNAWLKTYELIYCYQQHIPNGGTYNVFLNANAPGASTLALMHFFKLHRPNVNWDWVASSYIDKNNPSLLKDSYGLIKKYPDKWLMDENNNGDVTNIDNIRDFVKKIRKRFDVLVDLYFSDIAIDVGTKYNDAELLESKEVLGQNISGLVSLKPGGMYIIKQRGCLLPMNLWFVSVLSSLFTSFYMVKPVTSRPANSELYFVGIGYRGIDQDLLDRMFCALSGFNIKSSPYHVYTPISLDTVKDLYIGISELINRQIETLEKYYGLYNKSKKVPRNLQESLEVDRKKLISSLKIVI